MLTASKMHRSFFITISHLLNKITQTSQSPIINYYVRRFHDNSRTPESPNQPQSKTLIPQINNNNNPELLFPKTLIASPSKIHKLISSQSDPLLSKEIFDLSSRVPDFRHSYPTYHALIVKLGNSGYFSFMEDLLIQLKQTRYPIKPGLFSRVICIYGDAHLPEKAVRVFYSIIGYNCKPTVRHLNHVLGILLTNRAFLRPAFDVFRVAHKYGVDPNLESYNLLMKGFCFSGKISVAYKLFGEMFKRDVMPDVESYRILMQALCRRSQVSKAVDLLDDMLNKGFTPDTLSYTTLLNSLCRKKKLKEAYKLLCRMKVKGCNPNITHYNTVVLGLCREGRAFDAIKVLDDMYANGCLPNLESYRTLVGGLVDQGMYDDARKYMKEMMSKGFSPHFSIAHNLIKGLCSVGKVDEACGLVEDLLKNGEAPYIGSWEEVLPRVFEVDEVDRLDGKLNELMKDEVARRITVVDAGVALEEYLRKKMKDAEAHCSGVFVL